MQARQEGDDRQLVMLGHCPCTNDVGDAVGDGDGTAVGTAVGTLVGKAVGTAVGGGVGSPNWAEATPASTVVASITPSGLHRLSVSPRPPRHWGSGIAPPFGPFWQVPAHQEEEPRV
mmetsp:Transcript_25988/g.68198  ORF Transcript_25988/g.68198 Transcript_25988/m.68198 type:complete len:117 (-) Transcript_25988:128-478(-)